MGIVEEDIARVRAATDFVAIVGEHLALRKVGTRHVGLCPFHTEKSPSFSVNAELGMYYCFGCGAKGDAITFLREIEHLDFVEAVERLAARAGIALRYDDDAGGRDRQRRTRIHETLEAATDWYHERLLSAPDAGAARAYLRRERGYDREVVERYRLGWAPEGWNHLVRGLGVPASALVDAGLATVDEQGRHTDFFRARILFPILEPGGRVVGAGGRLLPGGRGPKYKNTSNTAVYDKSRTLYGLNWAKKAVVDRGRVVVCEGYTDVIGLQMAGVDEAVATCGTALADGHIKLLTNFARRIVLAYDGDSAGQNAADKFYEWEKRYEVEIRVLALPAGADPADLAREDPAALAAAVEGAQPYLGFRLDRLFTRSDLSTPEGRARAAGTALAMIGEHPDELVRDQYLMQVADRCRVDADRLRSMASAGPAGARRPATVVAARPTGDDGSEALSGPEREALRLAVHRREDVIARLDRPLFAHALAGNCFVLLRQAGDLHEAIARADPQLSDLLQRLAVEETEADPDDVTIRLVERAVHKELRDLQSEMRQASPADQAAYAPTIAWLKLGLEQMREDDVTKHGAALDAEQQLVAWLAERHAVVHGVGVEAVG
ncbi:MAG TPA: DNA primase [Acidimicrobiales bacterium]|nr:DNA primase [Acidimicrobiales bacterium]